jgi:catechol 2,3-dioxygenase-like lactoylglutathione lyase family enzyme
VRGIFYAARPLYEKRGLVKIEKLDHIALYMSDRGAAADFLTAHLGFHVVDHTERYTLVGAGGRIGKLTLFDAPEGTTPSPGPIERINVRVTDPETAVARLPAEADIMSRDGGYLATGPDGLPLALVPGEGEFTEYDLEGLVLRSGDPEASARGFVRMGFAPGENATTVKAGEYPLRLVSSAAGTGEQSMLFHLGCLVDSAEDHRREAEEQGLEIQDFVEGPNTVAVFVRGPEGVSVEYVEHKPTFSLT